jgi:hypothetical protein
MIERNAVDLFHRDKHVGTRLTYFVYATDVRMAKRGCGARSAYPIITRDGIFYVRSERHSENHLALPAQVMGTIHVTPVVGSDRLDDSVRAERRTFHRPEYIAPPRALPLVA